MTTVTAPEAENPKTAADLNLIHPTTVDDSSSTQPPPSSGGGSDGSKDKLEASVKASDVDSAAAASDVQKKMKRAERFGMTVQLSEAEKRNSRAERFGTAAVNGSDSSKQAEELKRKARAERFGTVQSATAPADAEVKKKARLARFGSAPKTDSVEEEKKKARAARFSELDAGTKSNGNKSTEKKVGTDKAGGGT